MLAGTNDRSAAGRGPLVLVVEDDPETRLFYRTVLVNEGFDTHEAHNGFQAFEKAVAALPDLVLTDIEVPGLDGIELCRRLRSTAATRDVPVLAVTGYGDRHYPDRALQAGANQVLIKPLHADVLVAEARRLLATTPVRLRRPDCLDPAP
jgi:two-component system phosphate regulon response regulator PhoB